MSRAFVKEPDGDESTGELPDLPVSQHPNYVTPGGLAQLRARLADCQRERQGLSEAKDDLAARPALARLAREIRYLEARLTSAILVEPPAEPANKVSFGAKVTLLQDDDTEQSFTIVGEDEADPAAGLISWVSPLARALEEAEVGDLVVWPRAQDRVELEVAKIEYGVGPDAD